MDEGYSDGETFEEVYEYWYSQYDSFEGEDASWKYCNIKEKSWLEQLFEDIDEEERWKQESQLMTKDSNATTTIYPVRYSKTPSHGVNTASISDILKNKTPQGRIIAITRQRPKDWQYENKPIFAPSWRLLKEYKGGYITYQEFRERYLNEMRHLYRTTTILHSFARECMQESVVLCCYCKSDEFCARVILKEILEKIIPKLKQKVEYPIQQESFKPPEREEAAEYQVRKDSEAL